MSNLLNRARIFFIVLLLTLSISPDSNAAVKKSCDGFIILVDGSGSMTQTHFDRVQLDIVKRLLHRINNRIPPADFLAALKTYGHDFSYAEPFQSIALYPDARYDRQAMDKAIDKIANRLSWSWSSMGYGLEIAGQDLRAMPGRVHIIIISDGDDNSDYTMPIDVVEKLKREYPDRFCIYAIQIGTSPRGRNIMTEITTAAGCGRLYSDDELAAESVMDEFIRTVFGYEEFDADNDGVSNPDDLCPETTRGQKVNPKGCEEIFDTDHDGVDDRNDKCPGTPAGTSVDQLGCWLPEPVYFNYNRSEIRSEALPSLNKLIMIMRNNPGLKIEIQGLASSDGSDVHNLKLSISRAEAVRELLIANGIAADRLTITGFGEKEADGEKADESIRSNDRRVQFILR